MIDAMADDGTARRLYLHVGLPKSGTTYLQGLMARNRDQLLTQGILYPSPRQGSMFHAAIELRGSHAFWGFSEEDVAGNWERLVRAARAHDGTTVISHEILSGLDPDQVAVVQESLEGFEVHVVVTARDLLRQVTAMWQEGIKNGDARSFEDFCGRIMKDLETGNYGRRFWSMQELTDVLERWGNLAPPERTHLVTAPRSGADPLELLRRFSEACGIDADALDTDISKSNESLGTAQIALLRDINVALDGRIRQPQYAGVVKRLFAERILPRHKSPRPVLPPELYPAIREVSDRWVKQLGESGVRIHGDLDDLLPASPESEAPHPDDVSDAERYAVAREALSDVLVEVARLRRQNARLSGAGTRARIRRMLARFR